MKEVLIGGKPYPVHVAEAVTIEEIEKDDRHFWRSTRCGIIAEHETAAGALNAVRLEDRMMAEQNVSIVTMITWIPCTDIGIRVIRAIAR